MKRAVTRLFHAVFIAICLLGHSLMAGQASTWPPKLYGFCVELPAVPNPSIPDQARLLKDLGFDDLGYALWLGETMDQNLSILDEVTIIPTIGARASCLPWK